MLTALPPELLNDIADNLHPSDWHRAGTSKSDLKAFSLTCRHFKSIGQSHLFRDIIYSFRYASDKNHGGSVPSTQPMEGKWTQHPEYPRRTLQMLCAFFRNQPSLGSAVRHLRLVAYPESDADIIEYDTGDIVLFHDSDYIETSLFHHLLALLPLLEELELADIELLGSQAYWASLATPLPSLQRLLIEYPYRLCQSDTRVAEIIGCFDSIHEVLVSNVEPDGTQPYERTSPSSVRIHSFTLFDETFINGALFNFLLHSPSSRTLRRLDTAFVTPSTNAGVELERLIQSVAPYLEHFGYNITPRWDPESQGFHPVDLSMCSSLRSLTLRMYCCGTSSDFEDYHVWGRCAQVLEACGNSTLLRTVTFEILTRVPISDLRRLELSRAIRRTEGVLLDLARQGSLSSVCFNFAEPNNVRGPRTPISNSIIEQLTRLFPRLAEKHMMMFP